MTTKKFEINEEPHEAEIGSHTLRLKPEVLSDELLDSFVNMQMGFQSPAERDAAEELDKTDPEGRAERLRTRGQRTTATLRAFVRSFLLEDSAVEFDQMEIPDRVLLELQRWTMEVYGLRPTGPSSGSSMPSDGTATSPSLTVDS